jgi:hypothetical protein
MPMGHKTSNKRFSMRASAMSVTVTHNKQQHSSKASSWLTLDKLVILKPNILKV